MAIRILVASFVILGFFVLFSEDATAEIYRWVDEEGIVHYSDNPPQEAESERMQLPTTPDPKGDPSEALRRRLEQAEKATERRSEERQAASAAKEGERAAQVARDQRCLETRKQLISLQQRLPVYRDEEGTFRTLSVYDAYEGEREYLDDATRALEIDRVRHDITTNCEHPDDLKEQFLAGQERMKSKRCETARVGLKAVQRTEARSSRQSIDDARELVEEYCENEN